MMEEKMEWKLLFRVLEAPFSDFLHDRFANHPQPKNATARFMPWRVRANQKLRHNKALVQSCEGFCSQALLNKLRLQTDIKHAPAILSVKACRGATSQKQQKTSGIGHGNGRGIRLTYYNERRLQQLMLTLTGAYEGLGPVGLYVVNLETTPA